MNKKIINILGLLFILITHYTNAGKLPPVAQRVKDIVEQNKLVMEPQCVDYEYLPDDKTGVDIVDVIEKHGGSCPGDPQTAPRIFSVLVNRETHQMVSDIEINDQVNGTYSEFPPVK
ncbi:hypothetical protein EVG59_15465 [Salmonella enterica subsp. enterica serovar Dortmund]|nr:hypothetical protein [Salmonella enterica subsp. enterica]EBX6016549.1 hypothetical protein [Salmonella enterica subsp. enterica serovar Dortmund]ECA8972801.1 hypothetical protein [Salmonella enterica subsp. enterica serovar Omuna]EDH5630273.1 hypothetical protein [Salmonella enterica subsp. enterica serovar Claibornei]HAV1236351.1 hypothetical protein [Salmonella enterica]